MRTLHFVVGIALLVAAFAPAAVGGPLAAALVGVALLLQAGQPEQTVPPVVVVRQVAPAPELRVCELDGGRGVVVFKTDGPKVTSRYYRI